MQIYCKMFCTAILLLVLQNEISGEMHLYNFQWKHLQIAIVANLPINFSYYYDFFLKIKLL